MIRSRRGQIILLWALVPAVHVALRLAGLGRTWRLLDRLTGARPVPPAPRSQARRTLGALKVAMARTPWGGTCLSRSLALWWCLRRQGLPAELRLGIRRTPPFRAHAWVELHGEPLNAGDGVYHLNQPLHTAASLYETVCR